MLVPCVLPCATRKDKDLRLYVLNILPDGNQELAQCVLSSSSLELQSTIIILGISELCGAGKGRFGAFEANPKPNPSHLAALSRPFLGSNSQAP
jgi:hypothetical protein